MRNELRKINLFILVGIVIGVSCIIFGGVYGGGEMGGKGMVGSGFISVGGIIIFLTVLGGILAYTRSHRE